MQDVYLVVVYSGRKGHVEIGSPCLFVLLTNERFYKIAEESVKDYIDVPRVLLKMLADQGRRFVGSIPNLDPDRQGSFWVVTESRGAKW